MSKIKAVAVAAMIGLWGCEEGTGSNQPTSLSSEPQHIDAGQILEFLGLHGSVPDQWRARPVSSDMRLAEFRVAGINPTEDAEFVLFYFGPGQGGSAGANISRWQSQFSTPDGAPVQPRTEKFMVRGMPVTLVELSGDYARGVGMGSAVSTPNQTLLAAIVETPMGNIYPQLHGPAATVSAQREAYLSFLHSIRTAE